MLVGLRGVGKTVLLNRFAEICSPAHGDTRSRFRSSISSS